MVNQWYIVPASGPAISGLEDRHDEDRSQGDAGRYDALRRHRRTVYDERMPRYAEWATSGNYSGPDTKAFYSIGEVMGVHNESLAWDAAENRARAQMVKVLSTYTAYLMRDYSVSTAAGGFQKTSEEQHIEEATKTFAAATLNGVPSVDRYKDEKKGIYYVVVQMKLDDVKDMLVQSKELNAQMREFVRQNADRAFERLEKEEEKREVR